MQTKIKILFLTGVLCLTQLALLALPTVTLAADEPTIETVSKDCELITSAGSANADGSTTTNKHIVPDSFAVGRCLSTKGQRDSMFLPLGSKSDGSVVDNTNASAPTGKEKSARIVLVAAIDLFVKIVATLSLIIFIVGAVITIVSAGEEGLISRGKDAMIYSAVGLAVSLFAFIIVTFVQSLFFVA